MKIAFFETRKEEEASLKKLLINHELVFSDKKLSVNSEMASSADVVSTFVSSPVNKEVIDSLQKAKYITTRATGFDNIDVSYAKTKGILVSNVPGYGAYTVAEFTFALILNLSRKIHFANQQMKVGANYDISTLRGFDLYGKTIGVIGTGKIGKNVICIAKGFGMNILAVDAYPDETFAKNTGFKYVSLDQLISGSDIVTVHTPYNKATHHLLNMENLSRIKKGAYFVNTARGEIVDTVALVTNLQSGRIAGAALDVLEGERALKEEAILLSRGQADMNDLKLLAEDHMLMDMPNVIVTPHIAFYSEEAEAEIIKVTVDNITAFEQGKPQNIVS